MSGLFLKILPLIVLISACHAGGIPPQQANATFSTETKDKTPPISFLIFAIYNKEGKTLIELTDKKEAEGVMKIQKANIKNPQTTLTASFYNNKTLLGSKTIDHPLYHTVETFDDQTKSIKTITSSKDSSGFFLRVQYQQPITEIHFTENINNQKININTVKL